MQNTPTLADLGREMTAAEMLDLTPEDQAIIAIRLALHRQAKAARLQAPK